MQNNALVLIYYSMSLHAEGEKWGSHEVGYTIWFDSCSASLEYEWPDFGVFRGTSHHLANFIFLLVCVSAHLKYKQHMMRKQFSA